MTAKKISISKELEWVRPFLEEVKDLVPVSSIPKIRALHASKDKIHGYKAVILKDVDTDEIRGMNFYIYVYLTKRLNPFARYKVVYSKIDILEHLAHELAHIFHWCHTPAHKKMQNKLCDIFMVMLEKQGYISEEFELKYDKPRYNK